MAAISDRVEATPEGWRVHKPPHRFDIRIEEDLIEEVARLRGFDSIAESHAVAPQIAGEATESRVASDRLLTAMADRGYREVITYSFVDPALQQQLFPGSPGSAAGESHIRRIERDARIAVDRSGAGLPRESAAPAIAGPAIRDRQEIRDAGRGAGRRAARRSKRSPELRRVRAGRSNGAAPREALDFYDVKADVQSVLALTGDASAVRFEAETLACLAPRTRRANLSRRQRRWGGWARFIRRLPRPLICRARHFYLS